MPSLRSDVLRIASELPKGDSRRRQLLAVLRDGPVGRVLDKYWNTIHDLEYDLDNALKDYDEAMSYRGKPGEKDAREMFAEIQGIKAMLTRLTQAFSGISKGEAEFVKRWGEPTEYAADMRAEIFPMG
jgi:hypothetical protein